MKNKHRIHSRLSFDDSDDSAQKKKEFIRRNKKFQFQPNLALKRNSILWFSLQPKAFFFLFRIFDFELIYRLVFIW